MSLVSFTGYFFSTFTENPPLESVSKYLILSERLEIVKSLVKFLVLTIA
jgi:hypothetical protein